MKKTSKGNEYYIKRSLSIIGWDLMKDGDVISMFFSRSSAPEGCVIFSQLSALEKSAHA